MKRLTAFMVDLIFIFSLAGCNQSAGPDRAITADIGDYVTKVDITHYVGGKSVRWTAENDENDGYPLIEGNWYSVSNPSAPLVTEPQEEKLTLEKVKELAEKGEELSWSDFGQYPHEDIGSGLYIFCYDIDENYYLLIGGGGLETPPMYILLISKADDSISIDIRTGDVAEFIRKIF